MGCAPIGRAGWLDPRSWTLTSLPKGALVRCRREYFEEQRIGARPTALAGQMGGYCASYPKASVGHHAGMVGYTTLLPCGRATRWWRALGFAHPTWLIKRTAVTSPFPEVSFLIEHRRSILPTVYDVREHRRAVQGSTTRDFSEEKLLSA